MLALLQRRDWQAANDPVSALMLAQVSAEDMTQVWHAAIMRPPLAPCRVLVAVEEDTVVGFATTMPSDDPDAEESRDGLISEFLIDDSVRGRGHGSRLLNAAVDTLRADGFTRATWWVRSTDDRLRLFLTESGWAADGSHREIGSDDDQVRIKQVRLHTSIGEDAE